jgi:hypothetical protein
LLALHFFCPPKKTEKHAHNKTMRLSRPALLLALLLAVAAFAPPGVDAAKKPAKKGGGGAAKKSSAIGTVDTDEDEDDDDGPAAGYGDLGWITVAEYEVWSACWVGGALVRADGGERERKRADDDAPHLARLPNPTPLSFSLPFPFTRPHAQKHKQHRRNWT